LGDSEMSSKMVPKAYALEKVGHFCQQNGRTMVVEYSDMPETMQEERLADGSLRFVAGSVAIHLFARSFIERMGGEGSSLPFHKAHKKIPFVNGAGETVKPDEPNGYKFEMFVFDALPEAKNPVIIEGRRADEFSPIKNAEGVDSPETCRKDQIRQWTRWAKAAGIGMATDESGLPGFSWEVSPLFADSAEAFTQRWETLSPKPEIGEGTVLSEVCICPA
jgi:UDP-N-acetylglucosamine/UDP-N-acetylgalactosamine diphosphorylase